MSTLYDPRVSAACLALREDPPAALDGPILQYARDALAAAEQLRRTSPSVWRRRTFAAIVAFIGVVGATALWESGTTPMAPVVEHAAPPAPVVVVAPTRARLEPTPRATSAKTAATENKKRSAPPPVTAPRRTTPAKAAVVAAPSTVVPDEPVQVKALSVDDPFAPQPIAPPDPAPALETTTPSPEVCAADPLTEGCPGQIL